MNNNTVKLLPFVLLFALGCSSTKTKDAMVQQGFIEVVVQNHLVSHGFDANNQEIIETVEVEKPAKKYLSMDRIQSISEKYILTTYSHGRLVYWEYEGSYEQLKEQIEGQVQVKQ